MPGYQPRLFDDHVWFNGTDIHTYSKSTGLGIRVTEMRGWDDRPDIRVVSELRAGQDGETPDNVFLGGRTISIAGVVHGSSWQDLQARKRALAAVFTPTSDEVLLKVPEPDSVNPTAVYATTGMTDYERVSCRVIEPIMFGDMVGSAAMTFQVVLRASDPRVYSDTASSTDSGTSGTSARTVTVDQGGSYETPPTLTVTGPTGSAWSVREPSSGLSLSMSGITLTSGDSVAFDVAERTITLTGSYESTRTFDSALVALWMLDESAGTTADNEEGTAGYDGTYTGGYTLNQTGHATGIAAVDLNGSTGYVSIPHNNALFPSSFTFEGWVRADSLSGTRTIIDGVTSNRGWGLEYVASGRTIDLRIGNGSSTETLSFDDSGGRFGASTWHHIALTFAAGSRTATLYLNGVVLDSQKTMASAYSPATSGGYRFGTRLAGSNWFDGKIDSFAIFDTTKSASDVATLYAASADTGSQSSAYTYLTAAGARWANLGTGSSTYTLDSTGLNTGSKLNVTYRDARI